MAKRQSWLRKAYRAPIDWVEERTTGKAFCTCFPSVRAHNIDDGAASDKEAVPVEKSIQGSDFLDRGENEG